jgi:peroxiredoxin
MTERLVDLLAALHAERLTTWPPEQLQRNIDQRRINVERFDPETAPKVGTAIAPFVLENVEGGELRSKDLVKKGPALLVFFRHESSPACNIALPYYNRNLWPTLSSLGVPLVAISPQIASALINVRKRHDFKFHVASDTGAQLGRRFGLTFKSEGTPKPESVAQGIAELTHPAIVVIDANHVVRFVDVTPNWMARTEAEPVIEAVHTVVRERVDVRQESAVAIA